MFLVPEGQTGEAGESYKKHCSFGDRGALREKCFHLALKDSSSVDSRPMINQQKHFYSLWHKELLLDVYYAFSPFYSK